MHLDLVRLLGFAAIFAVASATPGPAITSVVARVVSKGSAGVATYCAGLVLGDLTWFLAASLGLATVVAAFAVHVDQVRRRCVFALSCVEAVDVSRRGARRFGALSSGRGTSCSRSGRDGSSRTRSIRVIHRASAAVMAGAAIAVARR